MKISINNAIVKYNLLNCVKYSDGEDYTLPRDLKIKIIRLKINFEKVFKEFNQYQTKAIEEIKTPRYIELLNKKERTPEEEEEAKKLLEEMNQDLRNILTQKSQEIVDVNFDYFSEDEFNSFLEININNSVEINGVKLPAEEYVMLFHTEFVK